MEKDIHKYVWRHLKKRVLGNDEIIWQGRWDITLNVAGHLDTFDNTLQTTVEKWILVKFKVDISAIQNRLKSEEGENLLCSL